MSVVGVIGLGHMGGGMAARLVDSGHTVLGFDVDSRSQEIAEKNGVKIIGSIEQLVSEVEVVVTSLPNSKIVKNVWLGEDGIARHAQSGLVILEVSTIDPETMKEVASAVAEGVAVIDAPVSGGPIEARNGTLTLILGGDPSHIEQCQDVISSLSSVSYHCGPIGTGKVVKLTNNVMSAANILIAVEAFSIATQAGMEPKMLYEILSQSGGASSQFIKRFPWLIEGDLNARFTIDLTLKDLGLALDMAKNVGVPSPITSSVREIYQMAVGSSMGNKDMIAVSELYKSWAKR